MELLINHCNKVGFSENYKVPIIKRVNLVLEGVECMDYVLIPPISLPQSALTTYVHLEVSKVRRIHFLHLVLVVFCSPLILRNI